MGQLSKENRKLVIALYLKAYSLTPRIPGNGQ